MTANVVVAVYTHSRRVGIAPDWTAPTTEDPVDLPPPGAALFENRDSDLSLIVAVAGGDDGLRKPPRTTHSRQLNTQGNLQPRFRGKNTHWKRKMTQRVANPGIFGKRPSGNRARIPDLGDLRFPPPSSVAQIFAPE